MTPPFMIATRSLMLSASSWSWVTKTKVIPTSRWIASARPASRWRSLRSSAASGSSSSSTLGRLTSARARATRCAGRRRAARGSPWRGRRAGPARAPRRRAVDLGASIALAAQAEGDVVPNVEVLEERVALEDGVDVALVGRRAGDVLALEQDRARGRVARSRRSSAASSSCRSRRAEQREELAARDVEVEVVDDGLLAEQLRQAAQRRPRSRRVAAPASCVSGWVVMGVRLRR